MSIPFEQPPVCVDDFGEAVYIGHWTGSVVRAGDVLWSGAIIPGVKFRHADGPGFEPSRRRSLALFHECEANCNTCRHLERVKHDKDCSGVLYGRCGNKDSALSAHPYLDRIIDGVMPFAPDDWMGMPCHEPRAAKGEN